MCDEFNDDECDHLLVTWRICSVCERSVYEDQEAHILSCQCLYHGNCVVPGVRVGHSPSNCSLEFKRSVISNYVKKTFETENVVEAYRISMERSCPILKDSQDQNQNVARIAELDEENGEYKQKCGELQRSCEELRTKIREKLETEKQREIEKKLERTTGQVAKLSMEISQVKKTRNELRGEELCDKEKTLEEDDSNFATSDECLVEYEDQEFKQKCSELQKKMAELGVKAFSTRNSRLIHKTNRKTVSTAEISYKMNDQVVEVLKRGRTELENALEELTLLEAEFPTHSEAKKSRNTDEKFLE